MILIKSILDSNIILLMAQSKISTKKFHLNVLIYYLFNGFEQLVALGWRQYIRSWWNRFEICLILCSILDFGVTIYSLTIIHTRVPLLRDMYFWLKIFRAVYVLRIIKLIQVINLISIIIIYTIIMNFKHLIT